MQDNMGLVRQEMMAQLAKWGEQNHPDGTGSDVDKYLADAYRKRCDEATASGMLTWKDILTEEVFEAFAESDEENLKTELIQTAAVCLQWVAAIDRRNNGTQGTGSSSD